MLRGKYSTAEEVYDRAAAPTGRGYSRHDRHLPENTPSLPNVKPTCWTRYNSLKRGSLQSVSLMAFTHTQCTIKWCGGRMHLHCLYIARNGSACSTQEVQELNLNCKILALRKSIFRSACK